MSKIIRVGVPVDLPVSIEFVPEAPAAEPQFELVSLFPPRVRLLVDMYLRYEPDVLSDGMSVKAGRVMDVFAEEGRWWKVFDNTDLVRASRKFRLWVYGAEFML